MKSLRKELKKHYVLVKIKGYKISSLVLNLNKLNISICDIEYINENEMKFRVLKSKYGLIKKAFPNYKIQILKNIGLYQIKPFWKKNKILLLAIVFGLSLLFLLSRLIVKIEVIHSDVNIRKLVEEELEHAGIKRITFKKSYEKLQQIKEEILENHPDRLEWLEIEVHGMNYIIRVEERIITKKKEEEEACHVIATREGMITKLVVYQGELIKQVNQYVKKGDIIISGNIMLNEEVKNTVCAMGEVYAEVWYTVDVTIELNYEEHEKTGREKKNIVYETDKNKNSILKSPFVNYEISDKRLFSIFGTAIYIQTEYEYKAIKKTYTEQEAINKGIELAREKIEVKLKDNEYIISENVLKKSLNGSKMVLDIFFSVNEHISKQEAFEIVKPEEEEKKGVN